MIFVMEILFIYFYAYSDLLELDSCIRSRPFSISPLKIKNPLIMDRGWSTSKYIYNEKKRLSIPLVEL